MTLALHIPRWLLVAASVAAADVAWTLYFMNVARKRVFMSAFWSAAIIGLGSFATVSYVDDRSLLWAAIGGAFLGTWGVMLWKHGIQPSDPADEPLSND